MNRQHEISLDLPWGETTAYGRSLIEIVLERYPHGKVPLTSITLCKAWLLRRESEESDLSRKLNKIEIGADDQTWSLDGEPQGDLISLCCWSEDRARTPIREGIIHHLLRTWYTNGIRDSRWAAEVAEENRSPVRTNRRFSKPKRSRKVRAQFSRVNASDNGVTLGPTRNSPSPVQNTGGSARPAPQPPFGVTLCIQWLRELTFRARGTEDCRLEQVRVHPDDKHWSAPGTSKGDIKALVQWITGWSTEEEHEAVREHARKWRDKLSAAPNAVIVQQQEGKAHE